MTIAGAEPFEIKDQDGVKLIYGLLPLRTSVEAMNLIGKVLGSKAYTDYTGIAQHYGARMAIGTTEDLDRLRAKLGLSSTAEPTSTDE